jgi:hypothetical protein
MTNVTRRCLHLGAVIVALWVATAVAAADETYPPGTECANLRTIAERLLCGRQELKRNDAAVQEQKNVAPPPYDGYSSDPDQAQPPTSGTSSTVTPGLRGNPSAQSTSPQP